MKIGFTGTQDGCTKAQLHKLRFTLATLALESSVLEGVEFHHGDCIGADAEAQAIAVSFNWLTFCHPPLNPSKRAFTKNNVTLPEKGYLDRNRDIVRDTDILVACPKGSEVLRSGTWSTVRFARSKGKRILIINPDGSRAQSSV